MSGEPSGFDPQTFDPQTLWQAQEKEYDPMTLAQIHQAARSFQIGVRWRNAIEYVACVVVILGFSQGLLHPGSWMVQAGSALMIAATVFVGWQIHRRGSAQPLSQGDALVPAYRHELIRQRDALRSVFAWYLAPFIPGMVLMLTGRWFTPPQGRTMEVNHLVIALSTIIMILAWTAVWLLNQRYADKLQKRIDAL
jgi:hypothetical protein